MSRIGSEPISSPYENQPSKGKEEVPNTPGKVDAVVSRKIFMVEEGTHARIYAVEHPKPCGETTPSLPINAAIKGVREAKANHIPILTKIPDSKTLAARITEIGQRPTNDAGRLALRKQMEQHPEQLDRDLRGYGNFKIGSWSFTFEQSLSGGEIFHLAYNNLANYIKHANPKVHLPDEVIYELLYTSVQNYGAVLSAKEAQDSRIPSGKWAGKSGGTKDTTSYEMEGDKAIVMTRRVEKTYVSVENSKAPPKPLTYAWKTRYDLEKNEVDYTFEYTLEGKTEIATCKNPLKDKTYEHIVWNEKSTPLFGRVKSWFS